MGQVKLLLVEDNSVFRRIVTQFLRETGAYQEIVSVDCAAAAVEAARTLQPEVVVLDLNLPDTTGFEAIPALRAVAPGAKVVVLTLWEAGAYREAALEAGADAFVSKSAIYSALLPAISKVLTAVA